MITLYKDFGTHPRIQGNILLKVQPSNVFPAIFFWKLVEVLRQHLKLCKNYVLAYHTTYKDHFNIL